MASKQSLHERLDQIEARLNPENLGLDLTVSFVRPGEGIVSTYRLTAEGLKEIPYERITRPD